MIDKPIGWFDSTIEADDINFSAPCADLTGAEDDETGLIVFQRVLATRLRRRP